MPLEPDLVRHPLRDLRPALEDDAAVTRVLLVGPVEQPHAAAECAVGASPDAPRSPEPHMEAELVQSGLSLEDLLIGRPHARGGLRCLALPLLPPRALLDALSLAALRGRAAPFGPGHLH